MKKTFATVCALVAFGLAAQADYTWNGGATITQEAWQDQDNWTLSGSSTWTGTGTGPASPNSDMWGNVSISDASGSIDNLEGWNFHLSLTNADLTVSGVKKFQGGASLTIDENSSFTIQNFGYAAGNDGGAVTVNNAGTFTTTLSKNTGGSGYTLNLGETGVVNINSNGNHSFGLTALTATLPTGLASLTGTGVTTVTRQLVSLGSGASLTGNQTITITDNGFTAVDSLDELVAGTYYLSNTADGISVTYAVAVPEPATATLSLLALAGLAARRRRK